jgi:hypothetical protein
MGGRLVLGEGGVMMTVTQHPRAAASRNSRAVLHRHYRLLMAPFVVQLYTHAP